MSRMSDLDLQLQEVCCLEPTERRQIQVERTASAILRDLDELVGLALDPSTCGHIEAEALTISQIVSRAALLQNFLIATQTPKLKLVGG